MVPTQNEPRGVTGDRSAAGLEGHLRNLILTNANPNLSPAPFISADTRPQVAAPYPSSTPVTQPNTSMNWRQQSANSSYPPNQMAFDATSQQGHPSSKAGRKRPNQAQRRQMASQFTIAPDSPPQVPSYHPPTRPNAQWTASQPQAWPAPRSSEFHRPRNSWNGPPQPSGNRSAYQHSPAPRPFNAGPSHSAHQSTGPAYNNSYQRSYITPEEIANQARLLDALSHQVVAHSEIDRSEIAEKEAFRQRIEQICREVICRFEEQRDISNPIPPYSVELKCFGSLASGFATKASDLDLGLVSPLSKYPPDAPGSPIPRLIEKAFLEAGLGARLLSRTRVPIIKLCELPPEKLLKGLLQARKKWERGVDNDAQPGTTEAEHGNDGSDHGGDDDAHAQSGVVDAKSGSSGEFEIICKDSGETRRFHLQQGPKNSLESYYGVAKRVLRKAGGYDANASNWRDLTEPEWDILNRVCRAFIQGLADASLRDRITSFPSISTAGTLPDAAYRRSLSGIYMQIEGAYIIRKWESWSEGRVLKHVEDDKLITQWESLQSRQLSDIEPVSYNRELHLALEKLKKMPSMQLLLLQQDQQETPSQYNIRVTSLTNNLAPSHESSFSAVQEAIISQYVAGVFQEEIRTQLSDYIQQFPEQRTIQAVGCRHKSIHLANELKKAVENSLYEADFVPDITRYIELLQQPLQKRMIKPGKPCYIMPVPPGLSSTFATIKTLGDPHKMILNYRYRDPLEFPASDAGVQCDINFSAHLALQNTLLLRCYSHTDPRVRPMILFIKHWAKVRGINSGYRGTLSSYGYVLMALHYLVNVVQPFVCPNLQQLAPTLPNNLSPAEVESTITCRGYDVQFWRNEEEIVRLASQNQLNGNRESIGHLLRGFFEYYAQNGTMSNGIGKGFDWGRNVISLRTYGGILTKQEKGWTGAKTVYEVQKTADDAAAPASPLQSTVQPQVAQQAIKDGEVKEIRLRYLFAIEDPFETDHNVARTVTHNGIVSIRDEFRRAWRILRAAGNGNTQESLIQDVESQEELSATFLQLLQDIHGPTPA
ncbi:hypothetical protein TGAM01_v209864 [Trichoderma gamsii]|uniref:polynucleotide adenylyltransferase n=1 Tax=Trichoderma gamsii TaxID=398673 RepID=A0A2P4ZAE5_9HYPO|nr:hypothetical protein TGAM01_v209864 [Trichoderma gamsii]PON21273.1 hypothetical protein TGAM01_v209864 [Trichoderma gamsii]